MLILGCLLPLLVARPAGAAGWEKLPPLPKPNGGFTLGAHHGRVVVAGGTNWENGEKAWLNAIHAFDPETKDWTLMRSLSGPIAYAVPTADGWLGGSDGRRPVKRRFQHEGESLQARDVPGLPDAVVLSAGGQLGSGIVVLAGGTADAADLKNMVRSAHAVHPDGRVEPLPDLPGRPFAIAASATIGERLFIFGGAHWDEATQAVQNTAAAFVFDLEARTWKPLPPFPFPVRGLAAAALDDRHIYLAGGYQNDVEGFTDKAFVFDTETGICHPAPPLPYAAMVGLVLCEGQLYCLGGEDLPRSRTDRCYRIPAAALLPHGK